MNVLLIQVCKRIRIDYEYDSNTSNGFGRFFIHRDIHEKNTREESVGRLCV